MVSMSSEKKTLDQIEACLEAEAEVQPEPMETDLADAENETDPKVAEEATTGAEVSRDTQRQLNSLDHKRRIQKNRIAAEVEKHGKANSRIEEARAAIDQARQDERNAHTRLSIHIEQRDSALRHKAEAEAKLREINDEIRELSLTPAERKARDTRRDWERRRAEAEAAAIAEKERFDSELVPFEQHYFRIPGRRRSEPDTWGIIAPHNRSIQVLRKDLAALEADHREAVAYFTKQARDELADEYVFELRTNGRPALFGSKAEHGAYLAAWGSDSIRGRAYRARQLERGLPDTDTVKMGKPDQWVGSVD
jgi:hypothetical protein